MKEYYDLRAPYYDDWWVGAARDRPGWPEELTDALAAVTALPPARTLDVACGTGYLTQHLGGEVVGRHAVDQRSRITRREAGTGAGTGGGLECGHRRPLYVGWIAHASEQLQHGRLIRPRARYIGPAPGRSPVSVGHEELQEFRLPHYLIRPLDRRGISSGD